MLSVLRNLYDDSALYQTRFGTRDVVQRLADTGFEIRLNAKVQTVNIAGTRKPEIRCDNSTREVFDKVILATQANHAFKLLPPDSDLLNELRRFEYENVSIVIHRDKSLMPNEPKHWSTFNMISDGHDAAMCTIWLNRFHKSLENTDDIFQTINPISRPKYVLREITLQRPLTNPSSIEGYNRLAELQRNLDRQIWVCGSFAGAGIPLLESAVASSLRIVSAMGVGVDF